VVDLPAVRASLARLDELVAAHPDLTSRAADAAAWLAAPDALTTHAPHPGDPMPASLRSDRSTVATAVVTMRLTGDEAAALAARVDAARAALPDGASLTQSAYLRAMIRSALGLAPVGASVAPVSPLAAPPPRRARTRARRAPGGAS
jgi:hypothetical protein